MRVFFGKGTLLENNLYQLSHKKKKTFLMRIEARLFCVTGINCWAQKFLTQKVATLPGPNITTTTQAQEEKERNFVIVMK